MKKKIVITLALALAVVMSLVTIPAQAQPTEEEIEESIVAGLAWLVAQQNADGSWGDQAQVGRTGLAVVKLEDRAFELDYASPFDPEYEYSENVIDGLNYIFSTAASDVCGLHFGLFDTYETGIAMMAVAASRDPDQIVPSLGSIIDGLTYKQVLEQNVAYFANSQTAQGGWSYACNEVWTDNSNSGYATLGLIYATAPEYRFECTIPPTLKANLSGWIDYIQNDVDADTNDGGSGYNGPDSWVNLLKTGNLLTEMVLVGDSLTDGRVQDAIDYIERHWNDPNDDPGWKGPPLHYQAMYCLMRGLAAYGIETIEVSGSPVNWYDEMAAAIVATQNADGSWPWDLWGDPILTTAWALLTLEVVIPDLVPPEVACLETVNPHGKTVPPAGKTTLPGSKGGQNEDGFYELTATDNRDEPEDITIYVIDLGSGTEFGPFAVGAKIKYTLAPGATPGQKNMGSNKGNAGAIDWHVTGNGDACVYAVDSSGNEAECVSCLVPPLPK